MTKSAPGQEQEHMAAFAVQQEEGEAARRCQKAKEEANRAILRALFSPRAKAAAAGGKEKGEEGGGCRPTHSRSSAKSITCSLLF